MVNEECINQAIGPSIPPTSRVLTVGDLDLS